LQNLSNPFSHVTTASAAITICTCTDFHRYQATDIDALQNDLQL